MHQSTSPTSPAFFEAKYQADADPWGFAVDQAELERYAITLAALAHKRYAHAFEPGCSIGVLTLQLAALCNSLDAIDFSATAVAQARQRCAHLPHVHIQCGTLADCISAQATDRIPVTELSVTEFDLIVLSEIGYYFDQPTWRALSTRLVHSMSPGATLLAVHWLGHSPDHLLSGDTVHHVLSDLPGLHLEHAERHPTFRLDRWITPGFASTPTRLETTTAQATA